MNLLLLVVLVTIPFTNLSPIESDVPIRPYEHVAEIYYNGDLACMGSILGRRCILTSAKCAKYCEKDYYILTFNSSENKYEKNSVIETDTADDIFNLEDLGILILRNAVSFALDETLTLPNSNTTGAFVYENLKYREEVQIKSEEECKEKHGKYFSPKEQICATQNGYQEECYAPLGSPLYKNDRLLGIASWCESPLHKSMEYMVFSNLIYNMNFIKEIYKKCV